MIRISLRKTAQALICVDRRKDERKKERKKVRNQFSRVIYYYYYYRLHATVARLSIEQLLGHIEQTFIVVQP